MWWVHLCNPQKMHLAWRRMWEIVNSNQFCHWLFLLHIKICCNEGNFQNLNVSLQWLWPVSSVFPYLLKSIYFFLGRKKDSSSMTEMIILQWVLIMIFIYFFFPINPRGCYPVWINTALWGFIVKFSLKSELTHNVVAQSNCCLILNVLGEVLRQEINEIRNNVQPAKDCGSSWTFFLYWDQI